MKYKRYGKFRFRDNSALLVGTAFCFILFVAIVYSPGSLSRCVSLIPLGIVVFFTWQIYEPHREAFLLSGNTITRTWGRKKQTILIPSEPIFIISDADMTSSFYKNVGVGNNHIILKGRYAISILQNVPLETVLEKLHERYAWKYTNVSIESDFDDSVYVYDFVGNQELLDQLLSNRSCQVIVPETLLRKNAFDFHQATVHIDVGYAKTKRKKASFYSSYDFAIVSTYTFKESHSSYVCPRDLSGKSYPALSLFKAQNRHMPIRSGMTDQEIRANRKDEKDHSFMGICGKTALDPILRETDLIVYILEDIYLEHKERFDREITTGNYGNRIFIVTDRNIAYNGYTQKQ